MLKVLINGCNGKMGQEVAKQIDSNNDLVLIGGFDREDTGLLTYPVYTSITEIEERPDVIIDFSEQWHTYLVVNMEEMEKR